MKLLKPLLLLFCLLTNQNLSSLTTFDQDFCLSLGKCMNQLGVKGHKLKGPMQLIKRIDFMYLDRIQILGHILGEVGEIVRGNQRGQVQGSKCSGQWRRLLACQASFITSQCFIQFRKIMALNLLTCFHILIFSIQKV